MRLWLVPLLIVAACGGERARDPDDSSTSATATDAATDGVAATDTTLNDSTLAADSATPTTTSPTDASTTPDSVVTTDTTTPDVPTGDTSDGEYIAGCESLFAARIVEKQVESRPAFARDCDATLADPIGRLRPEGKAMCQAGESANACRDRLYATPPDLDDLGPGCWSASPPEGCMRGSWLPRCADGTDDCAEDEAVCQDGMRPMIYAEAATVGPSDVWLFHLGGEGGPCSEGYCWGYYRFGSPEYARAMTTLHPDGPSNAASRPGGIMSGDADLPYGHMNRVRFERCTDAASDAIEIVPIADGVPPEAASELPDFPLATAISVAPVWHAGFDTWRSAFRHLTTVAGRDRDGDGTPEMPSLANARLVVLAASSDASFWVTFAGDRLADELRAIAGEGVEVRIMIDGFFPPMLDNEARYHPDAPEDFDFVSMSYAETGLCEMHDNGDRRDNEACSAATYSPGGALRKAYDLRGVLRDASCGAMHGDDAPACYDRNHVLVHHVGVPVLVLADQEDNTISDNAPPYVDDRSYTWTGIDAYRRRIVDQGWDLVDHWGTSAREEGAGAAGDLVLILPKTRREGENLFKATHVRFGDLADMSETMTLCTSAGAKVATASYTQMIGGWLEDELPQTYAIEDAARALPNGHYWVTGSTCRAPE